MPTGPKGQKRPADVVGAAIKAAKIATGEIDEDRDGPQSAPAELGSRGGKARAAKLTKNRRLENARKAVAKRSKG